MSKIKVKEIAEKTIKKIDKPLIASERFKDSIVHTKEKAEDTINSDGNIYDYGTEQTKFAVNRTSDEAIYQFNKNGKKSISKTTNNFKTMKNKLISNNKPKVAKNINKINNSVSSGKQIIKTNKQVIKTTKNIPKNTIKTSQRAVNFAKQTARATVKGTKVAVKATISTIKGIIAGTKALIAAIVAGGWIAVIIIVLICLIGLMCSSIFGIFFSSEKTNSKSITMNSVVAECNQEFADKIEDIQNKNIHDEYSLDGNMATWKDVLLVYTVKVSNGINKQDVMTIDNNKKKILKEVFWDMNQLSSEVKTEMVMEQGTNTNEMPKEVSKQVLHVKISSKTADEMKNKYNFNFAQLKQYNELSNQKYSSLWAGVIYGRTDKGEYVNWRQGGQSWSNIKIGNTNSTIGNIGCLVTSISILIEKSGVPNSINPFNPGTFVEALNKNGGFDNGGNLQYAAVNKVVPNFIYGGNVNLRGKSRREKLSLIKQYFNNGYFLTIEVKGATPGNQHWVAITNVDDSNVTIVDPGSNRNDLWSSYESSKSSQFNYFKVK